MAKTLICDRWHHIGRQAFRKESPQSLLNVTQPDDIICEWNFITSVQLHAYHAINLHFFQAVRICEGGANFI